MKKYLLVVLSLSLLLLGACSAEKEGDAKLQKVNVMLDWYPNAVHSFLFAAKEKGYFKEQGLDVNIQMPADTNDPLKLVAAGKMDIALSYQPEVLVARGEDIPVKSFAAIVRHPLNTVLVPSDSKIKSPKDLAGKTIGYPSIPLDEAIISTMMKTDGGKAGEAKMVDVGWDLIPAMATKKTDALIGGYINHEQLLLEKEGHPMRSISPTDFGVPDYYELVMVASDKGLKEKKDMYKKFMNAIIKGQKYVKENPDQALEQLLKQEDKTSPLDKEIEKKSLEILLPMMDAGKKDFGYQDGDTWKKVADWLQENKIVKEDVKAEDAYVNVMK